MNNLPEKELQRACPKSGDKTCGIDFSVCAPSPQFYKLISEELVPNPVKLCERMEGIGYE